MIPPNATLSEATQALRRSKSRIAPGSVASRVADELRAHIADGVLAPGLRLGEEVLADALGVSRNTVREAFVELAGERLVERIQNRGVFVRTPDVADIVDAYRMRRVVETGAIRGGGDVAHVAAVRTAVEHGKRALRTGDHVALITANQRFHQAIVAMAASKRLNAHMAILLAEMRLFFFAGEDLDSFHERYLRENEGICEAIENGELNAAAAHLEDYLSRAEMELLTSKSRGKTVRSAVGA